MFSVNVIIFVLFILPQIQEEVTAHNSSVAMLNPIYPIYRI